MSHSIFGWDLPPGCRVSDIPGNRPEDEAWEKIYDNFWDKERLTKTHIGIQISDKEYEQMDKLYDDNEVSTVIDDYIMAAIEYGMDIGQKQANDNYKENKGWDSLYHQETRNPKLIKFFKAQRQTIKELLIKLEAKKQ